MLSRGVDPANGAFEAPGSFALVQVSQHQHGRLHERGGIRQALAGDIGRGAVHGFEDGVVIADVCARHNPQSAHQPRRKVGDNITVAENINDVVNAVEPRLWNMSTVLPILQDTTIVAAGPSVLNVSLSGSVPVGIVGDAGQWVKTSQ